MLLWLAPVLAADVVLLDDLPHATDSDELRQAVEAQGLSFAEGSTLPSLAEARLAVVFPREATGLDSAELEALESFYLRGGALVVVADYPDYIEAAPETQNEVLERTAATSRFTGQGADYPRTCQVTDEVDSDSVIGHGVSELAYGAGARIELGVGASVAIWAEGEAHTVVDRGVLVIGANNSIQSYPCPFPDAHASYFENILRWACDQDQDGLDNELCEGSDLDDRDPSIGESWPYSADTGEVKDDEAPQLRAGCAHSLAPGWLTALALAALTGRRLARKQARG